MRTAMKTLLMIAVTALLAGCAGTPARHTEDAPRAVPERTSVVRNGPVDCTDIDRDQPITRREADLSRDPAAGERYMRRNMRCAW